MIIGVSGKAGTGKGEFAKVAQEEFGATIVSFASGVKEEVAEWLSSAEVCYSYRNLYGSQEDKEAMLRVNHSYVACSFVGEFVKAFADYSNGWWYFNARSLMQWYGTEYRRAQDPNYWVKKALAKCDGFRLFVVDDVRFPNEAKAITFTGGKLVRINRKDRPNISNEGHPSEVALDSFTAWHYTVVNNHCTLDEYKQAVREVLKEITSVN